MLILRSSIGSILLDMSYYNMAAETFLYYPPAGLEINK